MKACQNHNECIVAFDGDVCPFCKMEKSLKAVGEEIQKSMGIMDGLKMVAEEAGLKFD
jgi:hypothetical protein